jgi:hypothetical protein
MSEKKRMVKMTRNDEKNLEILMWRLVNGGTISETSEILRESIHLLDVLVDHRVVRRVPGQFCSSGIIYVICPTFLQKYNSMRRSLGQTLTPIDLLARLGITEGQTWVQEDPRYSNRQGY